MLARTFIPIIVCCMIMTFSSLPKGVYYTGQEEVSLISTRESKNCFISYVMINGTVYLVKQKKDPKKQLSVVRDALAAYIAKDLDIAHQICIVSFKKKIPGKIKSSWPATLHTLALGETVRVQRNSKYNALRLRQFWASAKTFSEKGLTRSIISHMTWHRQLPMIIGLDLMIGNSDRHCGNLCYDPNTDTFCAIDMDDTFNKDLCLLACKKLKAMVEVDGVVFTPEEILALKNMRDVLTFLVRKHKPADVIEKLYEFAKKAGFSKGNKMYTDSVQRKLMHYEEMITQSGKSAHKLIAVLDKIIIQKSHKGK